MEKKKFNRLSEALSPYLKQHALNPVNWVEWSEEAFEKAEQEQKLVLISIGYSACHWCHVMAHESFEDEETAAMMNKSFICIKVDREERPDVDQLYMDACQLVNGNGGWPLNAFALPDKRPIHALTYAPKEQWQKILHALANLWQEKQASAFEYAEKLSHGLHSIALPPELQEKENKEILSSKAVEVFAKQYDAVYGGYNRAPKFPMPVSWRFLLNTAVLNQDTESKEMALFTLQQMALGGIYDAIGGGFARYSVDAKWFAPHFEKMLYDNAQLIGLYSLAYAVSADPFYKNIALETLSFCKKEWLAENGLYMSALDADSEGVEGLYYTYTHDQLQELLGEQTTLFNRYFQCTEAGNWEHGRNILYPLDTLENAAENFGIDSILFKQTIAQCLALLENDRKQRIKPGLDNKCICSWNALMLKGISEAALYLNDSEKLKEAEQLAHSILTVFEKDSELMRINSGKLVKINAFLEDYASLIEGFLALYNASLNETYLLKAEFLTKQTIENFYVAEKGFFKFKKEASIVADKYPVNDDVICSGNSMMANSLWTLSWYFDRNDWRNMAIQMANAMQAFIVNSGPWYSHWATLQLKLEKGCEQYILSTDAENASNRPLQVLGIRSNALPGYVFLETEIPLFKGKEYSGQNRVFPCKDKVCFQPQEIDLFLKGFESSFFQ